MEWPKSLVTFTGLQWRINLWTQEQFTKGSWNGSETDVGRAIKHLMSCVSFWGRSIADINYFNLIVACFKWMELCCLILTEDLNQSFLFLVYFLSSVMLVVVFCVDLEEILRDICEKQTRKSYIIINNINYISTV